jgi:hypothetical protein
MQGIVKIQSEQCLCWTFSHRRNANHIKYGGQKPSFFSITSQSTKLLLYILKTKMNML